MNLRRTLIKLTLIYLAIIMLVTGGLSYAIYRAGSRPLERRLDMREQIFQEDPLLPPGMPRRFDPNAVAEVKHQVATFLIIFDLSVLLLAGILSYMLAKRELKPMEQAFDMQSRFTSDAAHELRTPLTAMKTEIEVALRGPAPPESETRELLESNLEEIEKLETLSSSLLKLAQYEEGAEKAAVGAVSLAEVVDEAVERVKHAAAAKAIAVEVQPLALVVTGDRVSLVEMFVILLDNSVKYSDQGTSVEVAAQPSQRRQAVVTVQDHGYGIGEADLAHVFDRFYRGKVDASHGRVEGYGLGLSIARRIAELHKGNITIESALDRGTIVTVKLPLAHVRGPGATAKDAPETS